MAEESRYAASAHGVVAVAGHDVHIAANGDLANPPGGALAVLTGVFIVAALASWVAWLVFQIPTYRHSSGERRLLGPEAVAALRRHGFGPVRDVRQRDMIPATAWDRTDSLRPADLSRIAHARLARLRNRLGESRDIAEIAARHLAPPARPE